MNYQEAYQTLWETQRRKNLEDFRLLVLESAMGEDGIPLPLRGTLIKALHKAEKISREAFGSLDGQGQGLGKLFKDCAEACRNAAAAWEKQGSRRKAGLFRIYGAIFEDLSGKEG